MQAFDDKIAVAAIGCLSTQMQPFLAMYQRTAAASIAQDSDHGNDYSQFVFDFGHPPTSPQSQMGAESDDEKNQQRLIDTSYIDLRPRGNDNDNKHTFYKSCGG